MNKLIKKSIFIFSTIILLGYLIPQDLQMPVEGADKYSYNKKSFWHENWGTSLVHKGVDVFAKKGTKVYSATHGLVLITAEYGKGGKFVIILGPKWRLHYYAHLDDICTSTFSFVSNTSIIGTVGNSGNAKTSPSHLHYGIATMIPYPWRYDNTTLGWQKIFYLNPLDYFKD